MTGTTKEIEMIRLVVNLRVPESAADDLERYYVDTYAPMLAQQPGFVSAALGKIYSDESLQEIDAERPESNYQLSLDFQTEESRRAWVSDPRHDPAWGHVVQLAEQVRHTGYDLVSVTVPNSDS